MRLSKGFRLKYYLDNLMEKVFSKSWDDIWLTFDVAISQHACHSIEEQKKLHYTDKKFKRK